MIMKLHQYLFDENSTIGKGSKPCRALAIHGNASNTLFKYDMAKSSL